MNLINQGITPSLIRESAYRVISRTQDHPHAQVMGTAVALVTMCEATGTDIRELLVVAEKVAKDIDSPFASQMRALRDYARYEIGRA